MRSEYSHEKCMAGTWSRTSISFRTTKIVWKTDKSRADHYNFPCTTIPSVLTPPVGNAVNERPLAADEWSRNEANFARLLRVNPSTMAICSASATSCGRMPAESPLLFPARLTLHDYVTCAEPLKDECSRLVPKCPEIGLLILEYFYSLLTLYYLFSNHSEKSRIIVFSMN